MWDSIKRLFSPPVFEDEDKTRRAAFLNPMLWIFIAVCVVATPIFVFLPNPEISLPIVAGFTLVNSGLMWLLRRGSVSAASSLFLSVLALLMTSVSIFLGGTQSATYWSFVVIVVAASLLLGGRWGMVFAGLSVVVTLGIALAQTAGMLPSTLGVRAPLEQWGPLSLFVVATAGLLSLASRGLNEALQRTRRYAAELEEQRAGLEATVQERTRELARRARYLEATALIAREATTQLDLGELLGSVAIAISRQFGFYHAGIFLLDGAGEWAELRAASSEGGQRMLARGHRLRVGQGLVGHVSRYGESRIALDTGEDAVFFDNRDLPQTRSEAALPLRVRGQVIGVLDVQSTDPEAFAQEDIAVLQVLADQVATAINNARLFRQVEESVEAERRAYGDLTGEAWADLLRTRGELCFASDRQTTAPAGEAWAPHMTTAIQSGQIVSGEDATTVAIPIKLRGRVIGVIDGKKPDGRGDWTEEELSMMQTFVEQSAVALEAARLYQDSLRRATQERLMGEVTARMRETLDMDTVLRTAIREMGEALGLAEVEVRLGEARGYPGEVV